MHKNTIKKSNLITKPVFSANYIKKISNFLRSSKIYLPLWENTWLHFSFKHFWKKGYFSLNIYLSDYFLVLGHIQQCSGLLLASHSGLTPASVLGTICNARHRTWAGCVLTHCLTTMVGLSVFFFFNDVSLKTTHLQ